ncbi:MAG TPA: DNA-3-methyladenine glycosylase 2 family protein [Candidatus Limnocylindria bacterium]|nr:DNA-3-methyladenine glycosylase 2 family protein [Candidatus Limnocylindria bacterium]
MSSTRALSAGDEAPPDAAAFVEVEPLDLAATMAPLAHGTGDRTIRLGRSEVWRATLTPDGPATIRLQRMDSGVSVTAWGGGARWAINHAAELVGATDRPPSFADAHPRLAAIARAHPGLRLPRTNRPFEALLPAICEQKVTGREARAAFQGIVRAHGRPAPGPGGLRLPPEPAVLADQPYFAFHRFGLEQRRADVIRRASTLAPRLEGREAAEVERLLRAVPGIGPWTVAEVLRVSFGDADAVSVGDYHIPSLVAWALAGERRADDARMLQLLEPYRGQRGRVQRLLEISGLFPERRGPRMAPRDITRQ